MPFSDERAHEWAEWRGGVDQQLKQETDRLGVAAKEVTDSLIARLGQQDNEFARRMDRQDVVIDRILIEARNTNGRVTQLEADARANHDMEMRLHEHDQDLIKQHHETSALAFTRWQVILRAVGILVAVLLGVAR